MKSRQAVELKEGDAEKSDKSSRKWNNFKRYRPESEENFAIGISNPLTPP